MDSRIKTKDYCKVIFPYEAQNDDELTIKEGDIVTLINKDCIDIGWWEGELNGRRGVFPDNFVKLLPPDFDKEGNRPKKPPPPSTPVIKQGAGTTERKHEIKKIPPERPETLPNRTEEKDLEGFDSVVSSTEKLSHPTTSRPKATGRRPPSQSLTSSSLSSPDIFDSPSPEEDKEEHISLAHRGLDVSKKTSKTVTISQVSDNKASLPPKPGTMAAGSGKPKMEPAASSQAAVEELRAQVRELRSIIETMKDQQKREIKQLLSELDEEKKIRLRLQMEVNDIKKALQSK
ncbi:SH3 domain-containing kinase-binding protein 1 [Heterocephalus glaber]|uniref:SH3 domain-containing kinase-binding protein 1 n=1 Tax=Heterocephalus glaber TaxID=10181 RepID=G5C0L8_HETGA|nr:SH3 domain-containing kinase-binding protein 1 [Heterocephalus glaber]